MKQQKHQGFLSLITIFIITLFTLLSAGIAYLFLELPPIIIYSQAIELFIW